MNELRNKEEQEKAQPQNFPFYPFTDFLACLGEK